jgi:hypothetical protein
MMHIDYEWDLTVDGINLDEELNTDRLGWKEGDIFRLVYVNGRRKLIKIDELEQFVRGYKVNGQPS